MGQGWIGWLVSLVAAGLTYVLVSPFLESVLLRGAAAYLVWRTVSPSAGRAFAHFSAQGLPGTSFMQEAFFQSAARFFGLYLSVPVIMFGSYYFLTSQEYPAPVLSSLLIGAGALWMAERLSDYVFQPRDPFRRGRRAETPKAARREVAKRLGRDEPTVEWGGIPLPCKAGATHFLVAGGTGTGKTLVIHSLVKQVLTGGLSSRLRALVYDAKRDSIPFLLGLGMEQNRVVIINPFDTRATAWDIAADVTDRKAAWEVSEILIPEDPNDRQPFFLRAARHLLCGVIIRLQELCPGAWTLRDVMIAMGSEEYLRGLLGQTESGRRILQSYNRPGTFQDVRSTLATRLKDLEMVAAAWHRTNTKISLKQWLSGDTVLVLGNDVSLKAINQVLLTRIVELITIYTPEIDPTSASARVPSTWFVFDELPEIGRIDGLSSLLAMGRSKGTSVVIGFQEVAGVREVYGADLTHVITGQCANKAILRVDSEETAKWGSGVIGEVEVMEEETSTTAGPDGTSTTTSERLMKREMVLPSEILALPTPPSHPFVTGYFLSRHFSGVVLHSLDLLKARSLGQPVVAGFMPRPPDHQVLLPWSEAEAKRLGLRPGDDGIDGRPNRLDDIDWDGLGQGYDGDPKPT